MIITVAIVLIINILVWYLWIRMYQELFKKSVTVWVLLKQWAISALGALSAIKLFSLSSMITKVLVEEWAKTTSSQITKKQTLFSDHIASWILAWVWFAIIENILYLWYTRSSTQSFIMVNIIRACTNSVLHALFTWMIGFGIYHFLIHKDISKKILYGSWSIIWWVWLHLLYNRSLSQSYILIAVIIPLIWYFWLSYLLYRSDTLYISS